MSKIIVGVMGPGEDAAKEDVSLALELGGLIAQQGWVLLTGGCGVGVMDAASRGAKAAGGTVIGVLPGTDEEGVSAAVDIPILTGMREARNHINVLSSRLLFFVGMNAGTASELALALKAGRPVILIREPQDLVRVFETMSATGFKTAPDALSAVDIACRILASRS